MDGVLLRKTVVKSDTEQHRRSECNVPKFICCE